METKYRDKLKLNRRLFDLVGQVLEEINSRSLAVESVSLYGAFLLAVIAKNRKHFSAVQELCKLGFGEEAGLIVRSMANSLIDCAYITRCGKDELLKRFVRFDWLVKKRKVDISEMLNEAKENPLRGNILDDGWEDRKKGIVAEVDKFKKDYNAKKRNVDWSGLSIQAKAEKAGRDMELIYQTVYRYFSDIEHSNATALSKYVSEEIPGKMQFLSEPSESHIEEGLRESFAVFLRMAEFFCNEFQLADSWRGSEILIADFQKLYGREDK